MVSSLMHFLLQYFTVFAKTSCLCQTASWTWVMEAVAETCCFLHVVFYAVSLEGKHA